MALASKRSRALAERDILITIHTNNRCRHLISVYISVDV